MEKGPDGYQLVAGLFHHRWNAPTLTELLLAGGGARAIVLMNKLGVSRNSLRATLASLQTMDLAIPNPGYGHPLRPEYILTQRGQMIAPLCLRYSEAVDNPNLAALKWTAPVLLALAEHHHFNALQDKLGVGPRPLTTTLKGIAVAGLLKRSVEDGRPPRSRYQLIGRGPAASAAVAALAVELQGSNKAASPERHS